VVGVGCQLILSLSHDGIKKGDFHFHNGNGQKLTAYCYPLSFYSEGNWLESCNYQEVWLILAKHICNFVKLENSESRIRKQPAKDFQDFRFRLLTPKFQVKKKQ
jgi:hypothetical protein